MSAAFVLAMTRSLLLFAITAWALLGWGSLISRLFWMRLPGVQQGLSQIWLGFALALLWLQLIHYFAPLNWIASAFLVIGGLTAWWLNGHPLPRLPTTPQSQTRVALFLLAMLVSAGWIAMQSMRPITTYESGLYHLQSIRWFNEYAIVPGLGNLHGRLALNEAFLAFAAALNVYPYFNQGYALANGFLILLLAMEGWHTLISQGVKGGETSLSTFAALCTLPIAAYMVLRLNPAAPSPTTASSVLQLLIWLHCARLFERHDSAHEARTRAHIILVLAATALTIDQSNFVFVTAIAWIVLIRNWFIEQYPLPIRVIILFRLSWLSMLILTIWVGRGYFLSGYLAYPSTSFGFNVDWAVPQVNVVAEAHAIALAAKFGGMVAGQGNGELSWVGSWLQRLTTSDGIATLLYPALLTLMLCVASVGIALALRRGQIQRTQGDADKPANAQPHDALLLLPIVLALLAWWFTTPDPQLVRSLFWLLPIIAAHRLLMMLAQVQWSWERWQQVNQLSLFVVVNAALLAMLLISWPQAIVVMPGFAPIPQVNVFEEQLPRRLSVWIPMSDARCWDAPLPCTPQINAQLRRRGPNIQHGFQVLSPYPSSLAMLESHHTRGLRCQPPVAQYSNFAWVACGKPKG